MTKKTDKGKIAFRVTINGTGKNPYLQYGLKMNPFPQLMQAELAPFDYALRQLEAGPITSKDQIQDLLKLFSSEFVALCCKEYRPGETVRFTVQYPPSAM